MTPYRKTKIICTIGPASDSREVIEEMIRAGMDVARLNLSHGSHEAHSRVISLLREAEVNLGKQVGVLLDLSGPKIRLGELPEEGMVLSRMQPVTLRSGERCDDGALPVNYPYLAEDVAPGAQILLADGLVELRVDDVSDGELHCTVLNSGEVSSHKGVNMPMTNLRIPAFTDKDKDDLAFGLAEGVDYVALSFVRSVDDLTPVRMMIENNPLGNRPMLLAKIEKPEAIEQFEKILDYVDGTMVARGDLGVEMPLEELPTIQKKISSATRRAAKPVITATQMLRSMIDNPRPTRAEVTDTANAILDGASAVMLSEETAVGAYPAQAVATLDKIARVTEPNIESHRMLDEPDAAVLPLVESAITRNACYLAEKLNAACIAVVTFSGASARQVARFRQQIPIIAITSEKETLRKMPLSWGIIPALEEHIKDSTELGRLAVRFARDNNLAKPGQLIVFISGSPTMAPGCTDTIKVLTA